MREALHEPATLVTQNGSRRTKGDEAAFAHEGYVSSGGEGIGSVVRGKNSLDVTFAEPGLKTIEQRIAGGAIESGKWLIQEEKTRRGRQCSGQRHTLCLTAGKALRTPVEELGRANEVEHFIDAGIAGRSILLLESISHVRGNIQVRKESGLLGYERGVAAPWTHPETS